MNLEGGGAFSRAPPPFFDSKPSSPYNLTSLPGLTERCWSGRTGLPAKQLSGVNPDRGFESLPLRHRFSPRPRFRPGACRASEGRCAPPRKDLRGVCGQTWRTAMFRAINPATEELIREYPE